MRIFFSSILLVLFSALAWATPHPWGYSAAITKLNAASNPLVVLIGDSHMAKFTTANFPGYNDILWGQNGSNSTELLYGLERVTWSKRPAICVEMIGTNDIYGSNTLPFSVYEANVTGIIQILKANCDRVIILSIMPNEVGFDSGTRDTVAATVAAQEGVEFVNLQPYFPVPGFTSDGVHLNAFGYGVLNTVIFFKIYNIQIP